MTNTHLPLSHRERPSLQEEVHHFSYKTPLPSFSTATAVTHWLPAVPLCRHYYGNNRSTHYHASVAPRTTCLDHLTNFTNCLNLLPACRTLKNTTALSISTDDFLLQDSRDIIGINLLTKFHEDQKINVASRVHVFQPTGIIFELVQDISGIYLLTKFHEDRTVNVASREKCPPLRSHVFQANIIIFKFIQDIIETNLLTKLHEDWTINVASREKCPAPGGHVFKANKTIFELIQDIIVTNLLTKFHDDRKINYTVLTRFYYSHIRKNAPPP
ncbi:hypothetical protein DPMN_022279 [Dreissena polymorpha]|uniref:Uncharacterized protein n=1 Tax=Dreissena polymorpha TaxID=45954 RepID=A0A9D4SBN8_DREPO|nr:hypothetical protein DPMN_022279 [Dreissena polymorpha]